MHRSFRFGMDKMDSINYPNFRTEEIDLLLNQAQERYVKQRYGKNNPKRTSFEEEQKRTEDLKELIRDTLIVPSANAADNITSNSVFAQLPSDHWFIIQERVALICDKCNTEVLYTQLNPGGSRVNVMGRYIRVKPITHLEFDIEIEDAFKAPDYDKVLRLMYTDKVELIPATYCTIGKYKLRYIKQPVKVSYTNSIDCELSDHTHQEIVDEAIKIALEGIEAKRTNTFTPIVDNQKE